MLIWEWATACSPSRTVGELIVVDVMLDGGQKGQAYGDVTFIGEVMPGDRLLLNTTAVQLHLGSGGYHFIHMKLGEIQAECRKLASCNGLRDEGHIMKLRYTSLQHAVLAAEEKASPYHSLFREDLDLAGMPVLIGELHSMLPIVAAWLTKRQKKPSVSYVMTDGGALPLALSRHAATLKELGWIHQTITCGQAYGGDLETVNKFTALLAAKWIARSDTAIVTMGPGIVGTDTILGHSGMEVGEWVNAVRALNGVPIVIPRLSKGDLRERHQGISHHTKSALQVAAREQAIVPLPLTADPVWDARIAAQAERVASRHILRWIEAPSSAAIASILADYPLSVTTMGRSLAEDPLFFQTACCAAEVACEWLHNAVTGDEGSRD